MSSVEAAGRFTRPAGPATANPAARLRGDIEGLRAIAVLMVLLYHIGIPGLGGGFAGVDVFFVISGYLITSQLVKEAQRSGRVSLSRFYARRARRLLPAASLVLIATAVAGWWLLPRGRHAELGTDIVAATAYLVNWLLARREVDYHAEDAEPSLVQHYWSLSVEEQFYVLWPLLIIVVLWVCRRFRIRLTRILAIALATGTLASLAFSVLYTASSPGTAYFVTTTRAWQLGTGALLVLATPVLTRIRRPVAAALAWLGLLMIAVTILATSTATPWPGSAALLPTVGTALVIAAGLGWLDSPPARLLGVAPMRFLGGISYGVYLWHWPALRLLAETHPDASLATRLSVGAASIVTAWATLHLVENPIRFSKRLSARPAPALVMAAGAMSASAGLGAALILTAPELETTMAAGAGGIAVVDPASRHETKLSLVSNPQEHYTSSGALTPDPATATQDLASPAMEECQLPAVGQAGIAGDHACWFGDPAGDTVVAVVGDSKIFHWMPALDAIATVEGWRLKIYSKSACPFLTEGDLSQECRDYNSRLSSHLGDGTHTPDLIFTSLVSGKKADNPAQSLADGLAPAIAEGAKIVILEDNPAPKQSQLPGQDTLYECADKHRDNYAACTFDGGIGSGTKVLREAAQILDAPLISMSEWICPGGPQAQCPPAIGDVLIFRQGSHLTASYMRSLVPILHHELVAAGVASTPLDEIEWNVAD